MTVGQPEYPEFAINPEPRCPVLLLLDTSSSMDGDPIRELNKGIQSFRNAVLQDSMAALRVEIGIVTFGPVKLEQDFVTVDRFFPPSLIANGVTPMGDALEYGLSLVEDRKETYKSKGIPYYRPWIFLITDGAPTDQDGHLSDNWKPAAQRIQQAEESKKICFFSVAVKGANIDTLKQVTPQSRPPMMLNGLNFDSLFVWLSKSVSRVSSAQPGTGMIDLPPIDWGSVAL
jgi:uncharacterized protein YegL